VNKEEAAKEIGISVRTLQRAMKDERISYSYQRSKANGKQEVIFSDEDVQQFKKSLEYKEEKPAGASLSKSKTDLSQSVILSGKELAESYIFASEDENLKQRYISAMADKAKFEAKKSYFESKKLYFEGNLTFALDEAADEFGLSITDLKKSAKTFKGKNQKLMITKANLEKYLDEL
jgi:Sec-independent protein translocase protein TatA